MDSPLNKAGKLKVYIRTKNNILIEVNPKCRIPRTYNRFEGLMAVLLKKLSIRAKESSEVLLRVIKNPITDYFPEGSYVVTFNEKSRLVNNDEFANNCSKTFSNIVIVVGAISKGDVEIDYHHDSVSISSYALSAGAVCSKICDSFEKVWGIL
jgi:rRNA small subunit pseudouridine methyltransferase Nep1